MKALASTVRVVEWDELPASARDVPADFDPFANGILMAHQIAWNQIQAPIKVCPKGRRTGITFATALDKTLKAASKKSAGGDNVFYIGDTKEKGLEFIGYCAKFSRVIARAQLQGVSSIEEFLFDDQDEHGNSKKITAYRIRYASGFQIVALSSRPANIRGLQGDVVIDEAAFHPDVQGVLDAATALLIWGGSIAVISSHNGRRNPFNQLCTDIQEGKYGADAVVFTVTFDDAVTNGLYERARLIKSEQPTAEDKAKWYAKVRNGYGARKAAMREELDCIPRDGSGICLPGVWIDEAMRRPRPVLRLVLGDDFTTKAPHDREAWMATWIEQHVAPLLADLDRDRQHVLGQDYARHRHFSTIAPMEIAQDLKRIVPFGVEMHGVPTRQQEQLLWAIIRGLPNFRGAAMDATGPGQTLAEYTADEFGTVIHQVTLSRTWYGQWMPKFVQGFEDRMIDLPADASLADDLRAIEEVDGIAMVVKPEKRDVKDPELHRHGDFAVALALGWFASLHMVGRFDFQPAPKHPRGFDNIRDGAQGDDDLHVPEPMAW